MTVGRDQPVERLARQVEPAHRRRQAPHDRVRTVLAREDRRELVGQPLQLREPVARRLVAEIVGHAGEAVEVQQVRPQRPRKQPRCDGEVLGARLPEHQPGVGARERLTTHGLALPASIPNAGAVEESFRREGRRCHLMSMIVAIIRSCVEQRIVSTVYIASGAPGRSAKRPARGSAGRPAA